MASIAEIQRVKANAEAELLQRPGVTGVATRNKYSSGKKTDKKCICVFVKKKKKVPEKEAIPPKINGVPTDIVERSFVLHGSRVSLADLRLQADTGSYDPLKGGVSVGPCRNIGGFVYVGTLGAIVKDRDTGDPMLLSNFHVMCVDDGWSAGDTMAQPSRVDGGNCPADIVGSLQRASLGGEVDCAVASHTARDSRCEIVEIGDVTGKGTATVGMEVRKRGRTTGLTYGVVDTTDLTVSVDYEDNLGIVVLTNQIGIDVDDSQSAQFGDRGDSGSVVVDSSGKVVGLHFAGSDEGKYGIANPIQSVLDALNIELCIAKSKEKELKEKEKELKEKERKEFKEKEWFKDIIKDKEKEKKEFKEGKEKEWFKDIIKDKEKDKKEFKEGKEWKEKFKDFFEDKNFFEFQGFEQKGLEAKDMKEKAPGEGKGKEFAEVPFRPREPGERPPHGHRPDPWEEMERRLKDLFDANHPKHLHKDAKEKEWLKEGKDSEAQSFGTGLGAPGSIEQRLAQLEGSVGQLSHFIGPESRPDLTRSALGKSSNPSGTAGSEQALSQKLARAAADAKHAKDAKDVEKPREA